VDWANRRKFRRGIRRSLSIRRWSLRKKLAILPWLPVGVLAFALYTGPYSAGSATPAGPEPTTSPTIVYNYSRPHVTKSTPNPAQVTALGKWVQAIPPHKTLPQAHAVQRFKAARDRVILGQHRAAKKATRGPIHGAKK
jgi:hypothetical protein